MKQVVVGIISRKNNNNEDEFLLIKSKRDFGRYTGFYYPPGGHLKDNENEQQALIREIKEELNLEIKPIKKIAETDSDIKGQITHWWFCSVKESQLQMKKDEIVDIAYFTKEDMERINIWPATKSFFQKFVFNE